MSVDQTAESRHASGEQGIPRIARKLYRRTQILRNGRGEYCLSSLRQLTDFLDVQYFDTRRHILDSFELQLRSLLVSLAASSKSRHALQTSLGELQSALLALSQCDLSTPLKGALEQAAGVKRKLRELSEVQSANEEETGGLTSVAEGYARLCGSVRVSIGDPAILESRLISIVAARLLVESQSVSSMASYGSECEEGTVGVGESEEIWSHASGFIRRFSR